MGNSTEERTPILFLLHRILWGKLPGEIVEEDDGIRWMYLGKRMGGMRQFGMFVKVDDNNFPMGEPIPESIDGKTVGYCRPSELRQINAAYFLQNI